ncbi:MAG: adenosylmethionine--8-amino-7-oxononanoate transaminase [Gammaproteobacteria bacterium]|nr:adenosylmethionine--8-amino-7-oxononanoate transaminase [Gammaproteobacteria bacterium]
MADSLWFPYSQMQDLIPFFEVEDADGVYLKLKDGRELIDTTASWWCMLHGYKHPVMNAAMIKQIEKFSHVMMGGLQHQPAIQLAEKLVEVTPEGLDHVFFSDSGSVGVEVSLKMAMQYWQNQGVTQKSKILAFKNAYHGDTSGCMSVSDPDDMHRLFAGLIPEHFFADAPSGGMDASDEKITEDLQSARSILEQYHEQIAAMIIEPLLQAAGGFNMYSPKYLDRLRGLCDEFDILLIFDEVATGFGRTGSLFATDQSNISPDIMVLSKGLTGGYVGQAATITNDKVYQAFLSDEKGKAFMHGPTFMANPLACAAGVASLDLFLKNNYLEKVATMSKNFKTIFGQVTSPLISKFRIQGATAIFELTTSEYGNELRYFAADRGVWMRPYLHYLYIMPPLIMEAEHIQKIADVIQEWLDTKFASVK